MGKFKKNRGQQILTFDRDSKDIDHYDRFLLVKPSGRKNLSTSSPFLVNRILSSHGKLDSIRKLQSGDFLIEASSAKQSDQLKKVTNLQGFDLTVEPHPTLNSVKGVIKHPEIRNTSKEEMCTELAEQRVTDVYIIQNNRDGRTEKTATAIVTFRRNKLPEHIDFGYLRMKVYPYIPNPMRCFNCQRFGHSSPKCKHNKICNICGEEDHQDQKDQKGECQKDPRCANCKGPHPAFSRDCPKWSFEKEVQTIKVREDVSFAEARKRAKAPSRVTDRPFNVVASQPSTGRHLSEQSTDLIETVVQKVLEKVLQVQRQQQPQFQHLENMISQLLDQDQEGKRKRRRPATDEGMDTSLHREVNIPNAPVTRRQRGKSTRPNASLPEGQRGETGFFFAGAPGGLGTTTVPPSTPAPQGQSGTTGFPFGKIGTPNNNVFGGATERSGPTTIPPSTSAPQEQREIFKARRANAQQERRGTAGEPDASDHQRLEGTAGQPCNPAKAKQAQKEQETVAEEDPPPATQESGSSREEIPSKLPKKKPAQVEDPG